MRRRLVTLTVAVLAVSLAVLTGAFGLLLHSWLRRDADALLASRGRSAAALVAVDKGRLVLEETPSDEAVEADMWLYGPETSPVVRPAVGRSLDAAATALAAAGGGTRVMGLVKLRAVPVRDGTRLVGVVVAAVNLAPYLHSERLALGAALTLDVVVLVGTAAMARRLVGSALHPVAEMTALVRDWGAHHPERRFGLGPPRDEITGLAATLDGLLTRLAASLRHEALLTSQIAHELKTPLARLRAVAETGARYETEPEPLRAALTVVVDEVDRLTGVVETLLTAHSGARGTGHADLAAAASRVADGTRSARPAVRVTARGAAPPALCDQDLVERVLTPIVDNAVRHARAAVTLRVDAGHDGAAQVTVTDDGSGFRSDESDAVFDPGYRGVGAVGDGTGLGLPLARRLARLAGGDVRAVPGAQGRVVVTFPTASAETDDHGSDRAAPA